ncbi:MAG: hypothetical protein BMS9Abin26_2191 [Gammaproteobacteria bacterium]|nr:MAG: hypothetical protein BMS9Abin26_2191 [Gammaproteobacteria bacterium]
MHRLSPCLLGLSLLPGMFVPLTTQASGDALQYEAGQYDHGLSSIKVPDPSQTIRGTLYTHMISTMNKQQYLCKVMLADDGRRYQIRGLRQVVDGTAMELSGNISPLVRPRCGVALMMNVISSGLFHNTGESVNKPPRFYGTVRRQDMAGECWRLDTDFGKAFMLRGGDAELYRDGLNVVLSGKTLSATPRHRRSCPMTMAVEVSHYRIVERERPYPPLSRGISGAISGEITGEIAGRSTAALQ